MTDAFFQLDDLVIAPDKLQEAKVFSKAVLKKEFEIIIPKDEKDILVRDLKSSPYRKMADALVDFYIEIDPSIDYLAQNNYLNKYLYENNFILPWLIPIVRDEKLVYKKKLIGPATIPQERDYLLAIQQEFINYANVESSQVMVENLHNYRSVLMRTNATNHSGSQVLRLKLTPEQLIEEGESFNMNGLQFRGSYGDWKLVKIIEKQKSARKTVVTGYEYVERVTGEPLQVVGFAKLPSSFPNPDLTFDKLTELSDINIHTDYLRGVSDTTKSKSRSRVSNTRKSGKLGNGMETILREFLPDIGKILDPNSPPYIDLTGVTDFDYLLKIFEKYGHPVQALTTINRQQILTLINTNLRQMEKETYSPSDRLEYPELERELIKRGITSESGGGILNPQVLGHPAMIQYRIKFSEFPHLFHRYLRIVNRIDNGNIWFSLINPESTSEDIERNVHQYQIILQNREIATDNENSYANMKAKTLPNPELFEHLKDQNPLSNILELLPEKRDKIAWYQYFKRGFPDKFNKNINFHGKYLGCLHEYDRLYQMFEDDNDSYPYGKRYTRIIPNDGVVCGFCGDTLIDQNDLVDQGYDSKGQRINTYDNEGLIRETTNIDIFFKKTKSEAIKSGEKLVEQWITISAKPLRKREMRSLKYRILRPYEESIKNNQYAFGLLSNPNKILKGKQDRDFGEFLLKQYNIADARKPLNLIIIRPIFALFYSIGAIYDLLIQRLAVFLVQLNLHLAEEDPSYLNPSLILSFWTPEQIGKMYMQYNLEAKKLFISLKPENKSNDFLDDFIDKAGERIPQNDMTYNQYRTKLRQEFDDKRKRFLYTPSSEGEIFNGFNPLEHEIVRIYSEYRESKGEPSTVEYLGKTFVEFFNKWMSSNPEKATSLEQNARISLIPQRGVLSESTPRNRPLYDRYLGQRKFIIERKLEEIYIEFVNDNIFQMMGGDGNVSVVSGQDAVMFRKMVLLDKFNCEFWRKLDELQFISVEDEVARLDQITSYKEEIAIIQNQMDKTSRLFAWPTTGGFIVRDYRERIYQFFRMIIPPPDIFRKWLSEQERRSKSRQSTVAKGTELKFKARKLEPFQFKNIRINIPKPRVDTRIEKNDVAGVSVVNQMINKDLGFINRAEKIIDTMGKITYLPDLLEFVKRTTGVQNGQLFGVEGCSKTNPEIENVYRKTYKYPNESEFEKLFPESIQNQYMVTKNKIINLKKYIISHLRHHIAVMSRITSRKEMITYGFEAYVDLFSNSQFNQAFANFNTGSDDDLGRIFTNDEIDNIVTNAIGEHDNHTEVIRQLQTIFVTDIVRHLRQVRLSAGQFKGSRKSKVNADEMDAGEIFSQFVKILFQEIKNDSESINVNFYHKDINQQFQAKSIWKKMDSAERKGELEYQIAKRGLNMEEFEDSILRKGITSDEVGKEDGTDSDRGGDPNLEGWEELDMENDEDDYNDTIDD
tara:strand:+ start:346 stop:4689 length:4344 start_codon:yes stop_codon:yes gene_type:complete